MTAQHVTTTHILSPSLPDLTAQVIEYVHQGYRLQDGYPTMYGWQYEAIMEKDVSPTTPQTTSERAVGRPKSVK